MGLGLEVEHVGGTQSWLRTHSLRLGDHLLLHGVVEVLVWIRKQNALAIEGSQTSGGTRDGWPLPFIMI